MFLSISRNAAQKLSIIRCRNDALNFKCPSISFKFLSYRWNSVKRSNVPVCITSITIKSRRSRPFGTDCVQLLGVNSFLGDSSVENLTKFTSEPKGLFVILRNTVGSFWIPLTAEYVPRIFLSNDSKDSRLVNTRPMRLYACKDHNNENHSTWIHTNKYHFPC